MQGSARKDVVFGAARVYTVTVPGPKWKSWFNVLNHANLNQPSDLVLGSPGFGTAMFGRRGRDTGFPAQTPFNETARQIQLILRIEF